MTPAELYREMCDYLTRTGWQREEARSGWWYSPADVDATCGEAVTMQLHKDGIDIRNEPT